jgi:hypothetical protein
MFIRSSVATRNNARLRVDLMSATTSSIWVQVDAHAVSHEGGRFAFHAGVLVGAVYRVWSDVEGLTGENMEQVQMSELIGQVKRATESSRAIVLLGDMNLDVSRKDDKLYYRRDLTIEFMDAVESTGLEYMSTGYTWHSYGRFLNGSGNYVQQHSVIDHCYVAGLAAQVQLLPDATTDHSPVLLVAKPARISDSGSSTTVIKRRNYCKAVSTDKLEKALDSTWNRSDGTGSKTSMQCTSSWLTASLLPSTWLHR